MADELEEERVFVEERRYRIVELLKKKYKASVSELSQEFHVGEATIRRDLTDLEARGLAQRTHGGVLIIDRANAETPLNERETYNREKKERIAQFISQFIRNGETIMMDGGSTTFLIAHHLRMKRNLVVVTNSPAIADELVTAGGSQVILTGGELREITRVLVGPIAEYSVRQFRADRVILGMSSLMEEEGLFTVNNREAEMKRTMMQCGKEVIIAMDSSKIGKLTFSFVSDFSRVGKLITDTDISTDAVRSIEQKGVEVITV
jgi:DeoR family transcriptional regulator, fructose operon transcriptional repressor